MTLRTTVSLAWLFVKITLFLFTFLTAIDIVVVAYQVF